MAIDKETRLNRRASSAVSAIKLICWDWRHTEPFFPDRTPTFVKQKETAAENHCNHESEYKITRELPKGKFTNLYYRPYEIEIYMVMPAFQFIYCTSNAGQSIPQSRSGRLTCRSRSKTSKIEVISINEMPEFPQTLRRVLTGQF